MDGVILGKGNFARVELATHKIVEVKVSGVSVDCFLWNFQNRFWWKSRNKEDVFDVHSTLIYENKTRVLIVWIR